MATESSEGGGRHVRERGEDSLLVRRLKIALAAEGLHPKAACVKAGLHPEALRNVLLGISTNPRRRTIEGLARMFRRPVEWFYDERMPDDLLPMVAGPPVELPPDEDEDRPVGWSTRGQVPVPVLRLEPGPLGYAQAGPAFMIPRDILHTFQAGVEDTVCYFVRAPHGCGELRRGDVLLVDSRPSGHVVGRYELLRELLSGDGRVPSIGESAVSEWGPWTLVRVGAEPPPPGAQRMAVLGWWKSSDA